MTQIDVLYKGSEFQFKIEESDLNNFNKFINDLREKINEKDENSQIKIMTFNTKGAYLYLNEDNFFEILKDFRDSILKVVINIQKQEEKKQDVEIKKNDELDDVLVSYKKKNEDIDNDFFDDYEEDKKKDLEENKKNLEEEKVNLEEDKINIKEEKKENIKEEKKENLKEEKKEEEIINDNNNLKINEEEDKQLKINIERIKNEKENIQNLNIPENVIENEKNDLNREHPSMSLMFPKFSPYEQNIEEKNNIKPLFPEKNDILNYQDENGLETKLDSDSNDNNLIMPEEHKKIKIYSSEFSDEVCSICNNQLEGIKYICCICDKCILCDICEEKHHHPVFKYKNKFLSTISETYRFIEKMNNFEEGVNPIKFIGGLFEKDASISIEPDTDYDISIRPYKKIRIPIKIKNNCSKDSIHSKNFIIIIRNFTQVNIYYNNNIDFTIKPKETYTMYFTCESNGKLCKENITFEFISQKIKFKDDEKTKFNMTISVNEDEEEEELNKEFKNYDGICLLSKKHKQQILNIMNMKKTQKSPLEIYYILKNNNWDISICGDLFD